jgi:hypothetical protein
MGIFRKKMTKISQASTAREKMEEELTSAGKDAQDISNVGDAWWHGRCAGT